MTDKDSGLRSSLEDQCTGGAAGEINNTPMLAEKWEAKEQGDVMVLDDQDRGDDLERVFHVLLGTGIPIFLPDLGHGDRACRSQSEGKLVDDPIHVCGPQPNRSSALISPIEVRRRVEKEMAGIRTLPLYLVLPASVNGVYSEVVIQDGVF